MKQETLRLYKLARKNGANATRALQIANIWKGLYPSSDEIFWYMMD